MLPPRRTHRKEGHAVPRLRAEAEPRLGTAQAKIPLADQDQRLLRVLRQRVQRGEFMIDLAAEKSDPEIKRRLHRIEAFLQIGALLLGDPMDRDATRLHRAPVFERIDISDHRAKPVTRRQRQIAAAIRRVGLGREIERGGERGGGNRPATDERDRPFGAIENPAQFQSLTTTAETLFLGEPSISLSE